MARYIAITDIHGELKKLESVISKIDLRSDDIFVFMGDYIDRGPDSKGVVDKVISVIRENNQLKSFIADMYTEASAKIRASNQQVTMGNMALDEVLTDAGDMAHTIAQSQGYIPQQKVVK